MLVHQWELRGLGKAPFKFKGMRTLPSLSLAEHNPSAYANALQDCAGIHAGTCHICGMPIQNNYIIQDADGKIFSVGCECVLKLNEDDNLKDVVKEEKKRVLRVKRQEKVRQINLAACVKRDVERQAEKDRNGGLTDKEVAENAFKEIIHSRVIQLIPIALLLNDGKGGFCQSIANDMMELGKVPSGRAFDIVIDILAKKKGRRGSKSYDIESDRVFEILNNIT